jgi:hypothetical protein
VAGGACRMRIGEWTVARTLDGVFRKYPNHSMGISLTGSVRPMGCGAHVLSRDLARRARCLLQLRRPQQHFRARGSSYGSLSDFFAR